MKIQFNKHKINRKGRSYKWNAMFERNPQTQSMDVVPFTVAEMEFETAAVIKQAVNQSINSEILGYTLPTDTYYEPLIEWLRKDYALNVTPTDIVITPGVITAVKIALEIMTQENDGVLLLTPSYHTFFKAISETKRTLLTCDLENINGTYAINKESLEAAFQNPKTKIFILCHPHNPVGKVWDLEDLEYIHHLSVTYNVPVISDEIHADLRMPNQTHVSYGTLDPEAIICTAATKSFNLAGMKISNIIIKNQQLRHRFITHAQRHGTLGANALAMVAVETAYRHGRPWLDAVLREVSTNYQIIVDKLKDTHVIITPLEATYMLWVDFNYYLQKDPTLFQRFDVEAAFIASIGEDFGSAGKGFLRINIATPSHYVSEAMDRILNIINKL